MGSLDIPWFTIKTLNPFNFKHLLEISIIETVLYYLYIYKSRCVHRWDCRRTAWWWWWWRRVGGRRWWRSSGAGRCWSRWWHGGAWSDPGGPGICPAWSTHAASFSSLTLPWIILVFWKCECGTFFQRWYKILEGPSLVLKNQQFI